MSQPGRDMRFSSTLARGLAVLQAFRPSDDGLGNQELSRRTGIPKPTVCRLTHTLCADGYLTQGRRNDKYRLGPAALALGQIAGAAFGFVEAATPAMQCLADETGVLVGLAIQEADHMLMCKTWTPDKTTRDWMEAGYRMPIVSSSSGRAWLSGLNEAALEDFVSQQEPAMQPMLIDARRAALVEVAKNGFTCVSGEARYSQAINAVAVPYRPQTIAAPVAFLAGAASVDMAETAMRQCVGPALLRAVNAFRSDRTD